MLLQNSTNVGVGRLYSQGNSCIMNRVSKNWNGGKEELGGREG